MNEAINQSKVVGIEMNSFNYLSLNKSFHFFPVHFKSKVLKLQCTPFTQLIEFQKPKACQPF